VQQYTGTALREACSNGHTDIVELLLAVPGVDVNAARVSCVSGTCLHAVISHRPVRWEAGRLGVGQGGLEGGLRGRPAVAGIAVCRGTRGLL
jgi:hypothetical protein